MTSTVATRYKERLPVGTFIERAPGKSLLHISSLLYMVLAILAFTAAISVMAGVVFYELSAYLEQIWGEDFSVRNVAHLRDTIGWMYEQHAFVIGTNFQYALLGVGQFILGIPVIGNIIPSMNLSLPSFFAVIFFAISFLCLLTGSLGLIFQNKQGNTAICLVFLAIVSFISHIIMLVLLFTENVLVWQLMLVYIVAPILFFTASAQNTKKRKLANGAVAYSFILPNLTGFAIFVMLPMLFAFALSFMRWNLADNSFDFIGLTNFERMAFDPLFVPSLRNTIYFTALSVPLTLVCSLFLAILLNSKIKGRAIFRSIMFFPHVASLIAMAAVWNQVFHPSWGPVTQFLLGLGIENPPRWAADNDWVIPTIALFGVWRNMGYFMVIYLAGLQGIPTELYEAAEIDGATKRQRFAYITLPQLRHVTFFVTVMLTIINFRVFDQVIMITNATDTNMPGSSATMLVVHIYRRAFIDWDLGYASALGLVMFGLVLTVTLVQFLFQRRHKD